MKNNLKTALVVGDAPRVMGYEMVCKLLDAGYKVKAPNTYSNEMDEVFIGNLSQMDFLSPTQDIVKENVDFTEIEYDPDSEAKLKQVVSGCDSVVYLSSVLYDCHSEINSNSTNHIINIV